MYKNSQFRVCCKRGNVNKNVDYAISYNTHFLFYLIKFVVKGGKHEEH
jgi:hypothetical protein